MKDFEKYFDFIKDDDAKSEVKKIADKAAYASRNFVSVNTDFINPYVAETSFPLINSFDLKFELFPSFEFCERKILILYPDFFELPEVSEYVAGIRIHNKSKFKTLDHKDFLGSIMSLGVDRAKTGDIYVYEDYADILIHADLADYILFNLIQIGRNKIEAERIGLDQINYKEQEYVQMDINPSSLRLDNVVKHITNKSRDSAAELIRSGLVKVNWQVSDNGKDTVKLNDMISIRRYGRYRVTELKGLTKSGRIKVELKHYV